MIGRIINPLFLFLCVWGTAAAFYLGGVHAGLFRQDAIPALCAVVVNVAGFSLGYLTWSLFGCLSRPRAEIAWDPGTHLTARRLRTALHVTLAFGLIALLLCALRLVALSRTYLIDLHVLVSSPVLWRNVLTTSITPDMHAIRLCTIAITAASSAFSIGFAFVGILLYFGHSWRRYVYVLLFLLVSLGIGLLSLGRKEVTINILFMVLAYLFMHRLYGTRRTMEVMWHLVAPLAALVVLFLLINLLLQKSGGYERDSGPLAFLFSLYWYIASPLAAFAHYLEHGDHTWLMGQGLFFPAYKWFARLHLVPPATKTFLMDMIFIPYPANVYSYLRDIYEDLGFAGIAVVPYVLGSLLAGLRHRAEMAFSYLNLYLVLLVVLIFSFYDYLLVSNQLYLQVLFALVLFRFRLDRLDELSL